MAEQTAPPPTSTRVGRGNRDWTSRQIALWCCYFLFAAVIGGFELLRLQFLVLDERLIWVSAMGFLVVLQVLGVAASLRTKFPGKWLVTGGTVTFALGWLVFLNPLLMIRI
ncbi:MAG: hypothetical protein GC161_12915 [Planctomycetaceae bacterium]|nr:hypothetical protein [Planctomycetaceae bacterium]